MPCSRASWSRWRCRTRGSGSSSGGGSAQTPLWMTHSWPGHLRRWVCWRGAQLLHTACGAYHSMHAVLEKNASEHLVPTDELDASRQAASYWAAGGGAVGCHEQHPTCSCTMKPGRTEMASCASVSCCCCHPVHLCRCCPAAPRPPAALLRRPPAGPLPAVPALLREPPQVGVMPLAPARGAHASRVSSLHSSPLVDCLRMGSLRGCLAESSGDCAALCCTASAAHACLSIAHREKHLLWNSLA